MVAKGKVQKRLYYKIGEACKALGIQPYVLRYWETEFPALAPSKSRSGQRVYSEKELEIIRRIKELLYEEGYTIAGAKKKLETELTSGSLSQIQDDDIEAPQAPGAPEIPETAGMEQVTEPPGPPPPAPPEPRAPARRTSRQPSAVPAMSAMSAISAISAASPAPAAPDDEAAERMRKLRSGVARALEEAREILALLDVKSP
jgi:DNA-binding transcriptional MerR regulator